MSQHQFKPENKTVYLTSQQKGERYKFVAYRVKNFKAFIDTSWISVTDLVMFYGNNSAGKSAIVQPLKLLKNAYEKEKAQEEVANLWDLDIEGSSFLEMRNVRSDKPIEFSLKFLSDSGKEVFLNYLFDENSTESVTLALDNSSWNLHIYFNIKCVFFLERKAEIDVDYVFSNTMTNVFQSLRSFLASFSFIGPHRINPKRHYVYTGGKVGEINPDGTNTYEKLLSLMRNGEIDNKEITDWMEKFGLRLKWNPMGDGIGFFALKDLKSDYSSNLVDNGFGIGQSLPLVVKIACMEGNSTLLVDSPEAFLQTNMQGEVMDLIVNCVLRGNAVMAETSSEYMLFRLRRRIVQKQFDHKKAHIFFITDEGTGNSHCEEIHINEFADLSKDIQSFNSFFSSDFDDLRVISQGRWGSEK